MMPWASIKLNPGLNVELTETANQAGYTSIDLGRFKNGMFQKIGGWTKYYPNAVDGVPKCLHAWQDLAGNKRLAVGTTTDLDDITSGHYQNVAPQTYTTNTAVNLATTIGSPIVTIVDTHISTITSYDAVYFNTPISVGGLILSGIYQVASNLTATSYTIIAASNAPSTAAAPSGAVPAFTTVNGAATVKITLTAHGLAIGYDFVLPLAMTIGGLTLQGRYIVASIVDADNFTVTAPHAATSSAGPTNMNGGSAGFTYYIAIGPQASGNAYNSSTYGSGSYGTGSSITGQSGTSIAATDWTLDNWGELLISCPEDGAIYYWGPASGFQNSSIIASAPIFNSGAFVSIAQQVIVAFGSTAQANVGLYQDPLLVRWCDVGNFFDWTGTIVNQAGTYRIPTGSKLVGGASTPHRNLLWTDLDLWSMDYIGAALAFGFNKVGSNCGLIAKHAHAQLSDIVYWMGAGAFFYLTSSGVQQIPCPVWDAVFQDLDLANANKCIAGSNTLFSEIMFFYPSLSGGLGRCDKYAKYNAVEGVWDIGNLQRTSWINQSVVGNPVSSTQAGLIYTHDSGNDSDKDPLLSSFETGYFFIDEGREIVFVDRIFPDFRWGLYNGSANATIDVLISTVMYPGDTPVTYGPFAITQASQYISKRFRARQIKLKFSSSDIGSFWRLGLVRVRWAPDGRL